MVLKTGPDRPDQHGQGYQSGPIIYMEPVLCKTTIEPRVDQKPVNQLDRTGWPDDNDPFKASLPLCGERLADDDGYREEGVDVNQVV